MILNPYSMFELFQSKVRVDEIKQLIEKCQIQEISRKDQKSIST